MVWGGRSDIFVALIAAVLLVAIAFFYTRWGDSSLDPTAANAAALILLCVVVLSYRYWRQRRSDNDRRLTMALDIDGVLADQISGILDVARFAADDPDFGYQDVTEWDLGLGGTDIKEIIEGALSRDESYVLTMLGHRYVREFIETARTCGYQVRILGARELGTRAATQRWLESLGIRYDSLHFTKGQKTEAEGGFDVLVDDFPGHISNQLQNPCGKAILIDQPWNQEFISDSEDFYRAKDLEDAASKLISWLWSGS